MDAAAKKMSSSNRIIRGGADLPLFASVLPDVNAAKRAEQKAAVDTVFEEARGEGYELGRLQGYKDGYVSGLEDGHDEGLAKARAEQDAVTAMKQAELNKFAGEMEAFAARVDNAIRVWTEAAEERLAGLAVEIASRALTSELSQSRESILAIVKSALHEAEHARQVRIRVNPMDVATVESHQQEITAAISHIKGLEVVADNSIEAGCCIESESGLVDARVESYLARLADQVRRAA